MKKWIVLAGSAVAAIAIYFVFSYMNYSDYPGKTAHETDRWAVITDSKRDVIAVETTSDTVWSQLLELHQNQTQVWIGGVVEEYDNTWGFRFQPDTIIVAQTTTEGAQSTIQGTSEDLDYWVNIWARETYVLLKVTEIHEYLELKSSPNNMHACRKFMLKPEDLTCKNLQTILQTRKI